LLANIQEFAEATASVKTTEAANNKFHSSRTTYHPLIQILNVLSFLKITARNVQHKMVSSHSPSQSSKVVRSGLSMESNKKVSAHAVQLDSLLMAQQ
jgi:hypothetical protein